MPTPFMHMALAHRLRQDSHLSANIRQQLSEQWGAFLLGSIAPDARVSSGLKRAQTHFFEYAPQIAPSPADVMLMQYPKLMATEVEQANQRLFMAGYLAHLAMDEIWCVNLLFPLFHQGWGTPRHRLEMMHYLLMGLDDRDLAALSANTDYTALSSIQPHRWLPFMSDDDLIGWRDVVAPQLAPDGHSQTGLILGSRINVASEEMYERTHDHAWMQANLWDFVQQSSINQVEEDMYQHVLATISHYLDR